MPLVGYHSNAVVDIYFNWEPALAGVQYTIAKFTSTAWGADLAADDTSGKVAGILQNTPAQNTQACVRIFGPSKCKVLANSPNIAPGDYITAGTGGCGVKSTAAASASDMDEVVGRALELATADNRFIEVMVNPGVVLCAS
jgi:hypothetical protein